MDLDLVGRMTLAKETMAWKMRLPLYWWKGLLRLVVFIPVTAVVVALGVVATALAVLAVLFVTWLL